MHFFPIYNKTAEIPNSTGMGHDVPKILGKNLASIVILAMGTSIKGK
jgi:hypothetical protein